MRCVVILVALIMVLGIIVVVYNVRQSRRRQDDFNRRVGETLWGENGIKVNRRPHYRRISNDAANDAAASRRNRIAR